MTKAPTGAASTGLFYWALVTPKYNNDTTDRFQVTNIAQPGVSSRPWRLEDCKLAQHNTQLLVAHILAELERQADLGSSIAARRLQQDSPAWACRVWVSEAIQKLDEDLILGYSKTSDLQPSLRRSFELGEHSLNTAPTHKPIISHEDSRVKRAERAERVTWTDDRTEYMLKEFVKIAKRGAQAQPHNHSP